MRTESSLSVDAPLTSSKKEKNRKEKKRKENKVVRTKSSSFFKKSNAIKL